MATSATKSAPVLQRPADAPEKRPLSEDIAILAYALWQERGCPLGSPEEDWFKAEEQLKSEQAIQTRSA
jgi:DUF2934 family protein